MTSESPVSEDLFSDLDWNPFDTTFCSEPITSIGRSINDDMNVLDVELDTLMTEPQQQHPSIMTFDSCALRTDFQETRMPEEVLFRPTITTTAAAAIPTIHRLPSRVIGMRVHSQMAMACHDYTNKMSYTLTSTNHSYTTTTTSAPHAVKTSKMSNAKSQSLSLSNCTRKNLKSRSNPSTTLNGRKGKVAEDPDYLAHGTGIPR